MMKINSLTIGQVIEWYKMGWIIYINNPVQWFFIFLILFIISVFLNFIPVVGSLFFVVISPALFAGIFLATQKSANGEEINVMELFTVFVDSQRRKPFFMLGIVSLLLNILLMLFLFVSIMGGAGLGYLSSSNEMTSAMASGAGMGSILLVVPVIIAYIMAMVYAVPLMLFSNQGIKQALLLSLKASVSNILPMFFASIIYLILAMLAMIPMGLGLLVLFPASFGVIYASYKDIFSQDSTSPTIY